MEFRRKSFKESWVKYLKKLNEESLMEFLDKSLTEFQELNSCNFGGKEANNDKTLENIITL